MVVPMSDDNLSAYDTTPEEWLSWSDYLSQVMGIYGSLGGSALVGLLLGSGLILSMYLHSDDMALPTVILILVSAFLVGTLPGDYQAVAQGVMAVGIAAAFFEVFRRYVW